MIIAMPCPSDIFKAIQSGARTYYGVSSRYNAKPQVGDYVALNECVNFSKECTGTSIILKVTYIEPTLVNDCYLISFAPALVSDLYFMGRPKEVDFSSFGIPTQRSDRLLNAVTE